jgi:hypothetical protein
VIAKFESSIYFENHGNGKFTLDGKIESWIPDYDEDEIDAIVLIYRALTENNNRVSIASLAKIYNADWFPEEGTQRFNDAREKVNEIWSHLQLFTSKKAGLPFVYSWIKLFTVAWRIPT